MALDFAALALNPDNRLVEFSTPNDVICEMVLSKGLCNIFNIKNGEKKHLFVFRNG